MRAPEVAAAILAGGKATRMGGCPKPFLVVGGERIIDRQLAVLRPLFAEILLVANEPAPFAGLGLPVVPDPVRDRGPLAGILGALEAARAARVVVVACDMPYLSAAALALVADPSAWEDAVVPFVRGRPEPLHACYGKACLEPLRLRLASAKLKVADFLADVTVRRIDEEALARVDPALRFLWNCNTPADLEKP